MNRVIMLGNAILGEWRAAAKRPAMPASERKVRQRRNSCSRLAHLRRTQSLALGEATAWALVVANIVGGLGKPVTAEAIATMVGSFGLPEIERGILEAVALDAETGRRLWGAGRNQLLTPQMVGSLLSVTAAEREEAGIRDIDALDETPAERRRRLDRNRKMAARAKRAAEAGPRLTQRQMAAAAGISLSTWQRRHRDLIRVASPKKEGARARVSPARVKKPTGNRSKQKVGRVPGGVSELVQQPLVVATPATHAPLGALGSPQKGAHGGRRAAHCICENRPPKNTSPRPQKIGEKMAETANFVDENPERDFASSERLARILGVTPRQVRRLARDGVLHRETAGPFRGQFRILSAVDAHIALLTQTRSATAQRLDGKKAELLQQRFDRETPGLIPMADALCVTDHVSRAFLIAIDRIGEQLPAAVGNQVRASSAILETKQGLSRRFARERGALLTGRRR